MAKEVKMREFTLKQGASHSYILDGERHVVEGDGKTKVPLSELQAAAFKDKLADYTPPDPADPESFTADAAEATTSGEPKNGASGGASGASQGAPVPATPEAAEAAKPVDAGKSDKK